MLQSLIMLGIKLLFGFLTEESKESMRSQLEMHKGRAESVETSYAEQCEAQKKTDEAKKEAEKPGTDEDVFGSEEYNA